MEVKIIRSGKRERTIGARLEGDIMYVNAPADMPEKELEKVIKNFQRRFERKKLKKELNKDDDLINIFKRLNEKYFEGKIKLSSIEYVTNQNCKFGSCSYKSGKIRIAHSIARMPEWVRSYAVMHEIAHIIEPNHSRSFWDIVNRYKLTERARGYLIAKGREADGESDILGGDGVLNGRNP
ncbi:MAG: metal-dependent hydrolase [Elusimicrobia bacterium HGW-Elusimicrobia-2]|nr:MAG: metal-dependent hydrolase [Elusimicrobia bacterium HGW-Elusimicrobia-2]